MYCMYGYPITDNNNLKLGYSIKETTLEAQTGHWL